MKTPDSPRELTTAEKMHYCLQDYSNEFFLLNSMLEAEGIEGVRQLFRKGYKMPTFEEFLEKVQKGEKVILSPTGKKVEIRPEDQNSPIFIKKAKGLNFLVNEINSLGENIDAETIREASTAIKDII